MAETTHRVLRLLGLLEARSTWQGGELAQRLGVTERTVRRDVTRLRESDLPAFRLRHLGFVLQSSNLIPFLTVREQLTLVPRLAGQQDRNVRERADELLARLGLAERAGKYPDALSGGQRQRVAVARALMNDPDLILADEPTASLDARNEGLLRETLAAAAADRALLVVAHRLSMVLDSDQIVVLDQGRVVARGTHAELVDSSPLYRELASAQLLV